MIVESDRSTKGRAGFGVWARGVPSEVSETTRDESITGPLGAAQSLNLSDPAPRIRTAVLRLVLLLLFPHNLVVLNYGHRRGRVRYRVGCPDRRHVPQRLHGSTSAQVELCFAVGEVESRREAR